MTKTFTVFGREVEFSEEEIKFFDSIKLDLNDTFLEVILDSYDLNLAEMDLGEEELHDICLNAVKQYVEQTVAATDCIKKGIGSFQGTNFSEDFFSEDF